MIDTRQQARKHLLPHFTPGRVWRGESSPMVIVRGEGCYVWDSEGRRHLDGLSGLFCSNLGHGRSDLTTAAAKQMDRLAFYPSWGFAHPAAAEAAGMIAAAAPGDLNEVFFVNSGSEAVESALKFARCYHLANGDEMRRKVIARRWAYHGTTLGALAVTAVPGVRAPYEPMLSRDVVHVANTLGCNAEEGRPASELDCVTAVSDAIAAAGAHNVAMVIAEPVQNGRGALVPPSGYWQELRRICDQNGVLLCADEVINAFGRLGHWFGSERFGVVPDMVTFAKGATSAYAPLGGLVVRGPLVERVWDSPLGAFQHGSTFGGHPAATAVAAANMAAMRDERVFEHVLRWESRLDSGLRALMKAHRCVKDVRGAGYFYALELMRDRSAGAELTEAESGELLAGGVLERFVRSAGVLIRPDGRGATMLMISPPLVAGAEVIDDLLSRVDQVLDCLGSWLAALR